MTGVVAQRVRYQRIIELSAFAYWLEVRIRRLGDCCALKLWLSVTLSLFLVWIPALCGVPV